MSAGCPFCAEPLAPDAARCPHCGERLTDRPVAALPSVPTGPPVLVRLWGAMTALFGGLALVAMLAAWSSPPPTAPPPDPVGFVVGGGMSGLLLLGGAGLFFGRWFAVWILGLLGGLGFLGGLALAAHEPAQGAVVMVGMLGLCGVPVALAILGRDRMRR